MPSLHEIRIYPVKSCAGISLEQAELTSAGLRHGTIYDRQWMFVDQHGQMLSQRTHPHMARIQTRLHNDAIYLSYPELSDLILPAEPDGATMSVEIWEEQFTAQRLSEHYQDWIQQAIGETAYLVKLCASSPRITSAKWSAPDQANHHFADAYPYLITNLASLEDLNQRLQQAQRAPISMDRFRANLILDDLNAYEEDYLSHLHFTQQVSLRLVKPCTRCNIPSIDQDSGEIGPDPLDILQSYRSNPIVDGGICFGMNAVLQHGQTYTIQTGMPLTADLAF